MKILTSTKYFTFSFVTITYLLAIAGTVLTVLSLLGKGGIKAEIIAIACFVFASVLFFISNSIVIINSALGPAHVLDEFRSTLHLGMGAILGGIMCAMSGIFMLSRVLLKVPAFKAKAIS